MMVLQSLLLIIPALLLILIKGITSTELECDVSMYEEYINATLAQLTLQNYEYSKGEIRFVSAQTWFNNLSKTFVPKSAYLFNKNYIYGVPYFDTIIAGKQPADRFAGSEAILLPLCTPPQSLYFGWTMYMISHIYNALSNPIQLKEIFAALGDTLNHMIINTTDQQSNNMEDNIMNNFIGAFDKYSLIISSADEQTYNDINDILNTVIPSSSDVSKAINNYKMINHPNVKWSLYPFVPYDAFTGVIRMEYDAINTNMTLFNQYFNQTIPFYKITPKSNATKIPIFPFNTPLFHLASSLTPRQPYLYNNESFFRTPMDENNIDEHITSIKNGYNYYLNKIKNYYRNVQDLTLMEEFHMNPYRHVIKGPNYTNDNNDYINVTIGEYGLYCLEQDENCDGDNRDTVYYVDDKNETSFMDNNTLYIIFGVNHDRLGESIYNSITLYYYQKNGMTKTPIISMLNYQYEEKPLEDTPIIKNEPKPFNVDNYFIIQVARTTYVNPYTSEAECGIDYNVTASLCLNSTDVNDNDPFFFFARVTLNPITFTHPDKANLLDYTILRYN